jgi:hypothetical protein
MTSGTAQNRLINAVPDRGPARDFPGRRPAPIITQPSRPGHSLSLGSDPREGRREGTSEACSRNLPNSSGSKYGPGIAVRLSNSKGYFLWYGNSPNTISIWRMDSATSWTQLKKSGTLAISATDVWKIQAVGATISAYQNDHLVAQVTDSRYTAGSPGVWLYYASNQVTNWSGGDVSVAPAYSIGGTVRG